MTAIIATPRSQPATKCVLAFEDIALLAGAACQLAALTSSCGGCIHACSIHGQLHHHCRQQCIP